MIFEIFAGALICFVLLPHSVCTAFCTPFCSSFFEFDKHFKRAPNELIFWPWNHIIPKIWLHFLELTYQGLEIGFGIWIKISVTSNKLLKFSGKHQSSNIEEISQIQISARMWSQVRWQLIFKNQFLHQHLLLRTKMVRYFY